VDIYASIYENLLVLYGTSLFGFFAGQLTFFEGKRVDGLIIDADYFISYLWVGDSCIKLEHSE